MDACKAAGVAIWAERDGQEVLALLYVMGIRWASLPAYAAWKLFDSKHVGRLCAGDGCAVLATHLADC